MQSFFNSGKVMCVCVCSHEVCVAIEMGQKQVEVAAVGRKTDCRNCEVSTLLGEAEPCCKVSNEQDQVGLSVCEQAMHQGDMQQECCGRC